MLTIHVSVKWGLRGAVIEGHYLPERDWDLPLAGFMEATIQLFVRVLIEEIELDLKQLLYTHLERREPTKWSSLLPRRVWELARMRYKWSRETLGEDGVIEFPSIHWLTFGNVLKTLNDLGPAEWQECLRAETRRRSQFRRAVEVVKGFRDYHVAHPKPGKVSDAELVALCRAARRLPLVLCPAEWKQAYSTIYRKRAFQIPGQPENDACGDEDTAYRASVLEWWDKNYGDWIRFKTGVDSNHPTEENLRTGNG